AHCCRSVVYGAWCLPLVVRGEVAEIIKEAPLLRTRPCKDDRPNRSAAQCHNAVLIVERPIMKAVGLNVVLPECTLSARDFEVPSQREGDKPPRVVVQLTVTAVIRAVNLVQSQRSNEVDDPSVHVPLALNDDGASLEADEVPAPSEPVALNLCHFFILASSASCMVRLPSSRASTSSSSVSSATM